VLWWGKNGIKTGRHPEEMDGVQVFLIHRRLAILDLSPTGWQPMGTADGRYWIVFNGEIYNFLELRQELEAIGYTFRSRSDTEVLLSAWAEWGPDSLNRLVGMFAFALLDTQENKIFLVRDFFGIKPLYYTQWSGGLAFSSEIQSLLELPGVKRKINPQGLYSYLRFGLTDAADQTMLSDILQLPPANYLEIEIDGLKINKPRIFWQVNLDQKTSIPFEEAKEYMRNLFIENVKLHLRSDVPVGSALSGGIDSSSIVSIIRYLEPSAELHAFSFFADDPKISEERWIRIVGKQARVIIHPVRILPEELVADLDRLIQAQGEPFGSTSIYAQYRVFREAQKNGIKVMLDGQGGDELLGGYMRYSAARLASLLSQHKWLDAVRFARALYRLPGLKKTILLSAHFLVPLWLYGMARRFVEDDLVPAWLSRRWFEKHGVEFIPIRRSRYGSEILREELYETLRISSLPMLLRYEDRNSMAHSVESRVPFLTPKLAEFLLSLPEEYLISLDGTTKYIFREAMRGLVPDAILDRRDKIGFSTPEYSWLRHLTPWVERTLETAKNLNIVPFFDYKGLEKEWSQVRKNKKKFDFRVWRWINTIRWVEIFNIEPQ
jgi:asparagine synthase (glutamine-hydrolysing)